MAVDEHLAHEPPQMTGLIVLIVEGLLFGPWIALGAMVRQRDVFVRHQAHASTLERNELEREASEARLRLLQAQVKPHFLFNTLANVQALVDTGSPRASGVLKSLIAYLRAAVPRLQESTTTTSATSSSSCARISKSCTCECPIACSSPCESTNPRRACGARR